MLILDPSVVIPDNHVDLLDFWDEFVEWTADDRVALGQYSHEFIVAWCTSTIWAGDSSLVPNHLARDISSRITMMLTRQPVEHLALLCGRETVPTHLSNIQGLSDSFVSDLVGAVGDNVVGGIASSSRYWSELSSSVDKIGRASCRERVF